VSSRATDYDLLIGELKDTHLTVPEDTSKHENDFHQIQRSCGTPSTGVQVIGGGTASLTAETRCFGCASTRS
jgi:hypothetical protein